MKQDPRDWFSNDRNVDYWDGIYDQAGFSEDCFRRRIAVALSWLESRQTPSTSRVLEAGCGAGRLANEAVQRGHRVVGLDLSYQMLARAHRRTPPDHRSRLGFLQARVDSIPLPDRSFDGAVCLGVVAYLPSEATALRELARVIKPGGLLVISIYNRARLVHYLDVPLRLGNLLRRLVTRISGRRKGNLVEIDPHRTLRTFYLPDFRKSLERAGFTVRGSEMIPVELVTLFGRAILPRTIAERITNFVEQSSKIPFFESFGTMCVFRADRNAD